MKRVKYAGEERLLFPCAHTWCTGPRPLAGARYQGCLSFLPSNYTQPRLSQHIGTQERAGATLFDKTRATLISSQQQKLRKGAPTPSAVGGVFKFSFNCSCHEDQCHAVYNAFLAWPSVQPQRLEPQSKAESCQKANLFTTFASQMVGNTRKVYMEQSVIQTNCVNRYQRRQPRDWGPVH